MRETLLQPRPHSAALVLRLGLAAIFIAHGYIKIATDLLLVLELSLTVQRAIGWAELVCGLMLAAGLFSRLAALVLVGLQVTAVVMVTGKFALQVVRLNPLGEPDYTRVGPEYNLVLIAMSIAVFALGGGIYSLDHLIGSRGGHKAPAGAAAPVTGSPIGAA